MLFPPGQQAAERFTGWGPTLTSTSAPTHLESAASIGTPDKGPLTGAKLQLHSRGVLRHVRKKGGAPASCQLCHFDESVRSALIVHDKPHYGSQNRGAARATAQRTPGGGAVSVFADYRKLLRNDLV